MDDIFLLLFLLSGAAMVFGIIKPSLVVRWGAIEKRGRKNVFKYYGTALIVFFILFGVTTGGTESGSLNTTAPATSTIIEQVVSDKDKDSATEVDKLIADLGDTKALTLDSSSKVQAARTAYNELNDSQKAFVTKLDVLKVAENQLYLIEKTNQEKEAAAKAAAEQTTVNGKLKVHFINVGQADSILIQQGSESMLVDAGNNADSELVKKYVSSQGITQLSYVVGTHPHEDHIGGLDYIINSFSVGKIYMPRASSTTQTFEDVLTAINNKGMKVTTPIPGDNFNIGGATVTILAPNSSSYDDTNNYSIVLRITYGSTSFMLDGDAESLSESQILSKDFDVKADVLKIGHHGSSSSTGNAFLDKVNPKYAVVSVGDGNSYGHPTEQTMSRLQNKGITVYRTDECGTIVATSDGSSISFNTKPGSYSAAGSSSSSNTETSSSVNSSTTQTQNNDYTVYKTTTGSKYHRDGCRYLSKSKIEITKSEAVNEGLTPCSVCNP